MSPRPGRASPRPPPRTGSGSGRWVSPTPTSPASPSNTPAARPQTPRAPPYPLALPDALPILDPSCQERHLRGDRDHDDPRRITGQRRRGHRCHRDLGGHRHAHLQGLGRGLGGGSARHRRHPHRRQIHRRRGRRPREPPPTLLPYPTLFRSWTRLAKSGTFAVTATTTTLAASPASVAAGTDVTATWAGIATPTSKDWVGVWAVGQPDTDVTRIAVKYTGGAAADPESPPLPSCPTRRSSDLGPVLPRAAPSR